MLRGQAVCPRLETLGSFLPLLGFCWQLQRWALWKVLGERQPQTCSLHSLRKALRKLIKIRQEAFPSWLRG